MGEGPGSGSRIFIRKTSTKEANQQWGFPGDSDVKESTCNAGDLGLIRGLGRSLEEGNS